MIDSVSLLILPLHSDETMPQRLVARNRLGDNRTVPGPQKMCHVLCCEKPLRLATGMINDEAQYSQHNQPLSSLPWLGLSTKQSISASLSLADVSSSVSLKINPLRLCIFFLWSFSLWLPCFYEYDLDPRGNVDFNPRNQLPVSLFVLLALHLVSCQLEASSMNSYSGWFCRAVCL